MTAAERKLWSRLRAGRFYGLRWLRQEPFGPYVVDFYCATARIVVELDGAAHGFTAQRDREREAWLSEQGVRVVRFPNDVVLNDTEAVLEHLLFFCQGSIGLSGSAGDATDSSGSSLGE
jgi:very-short-patch-repair endonuclease